MKKHLSTILLVSIFLIGLCILLYPMVSDYWNSKVQSRAIVDYESALQNLTTEDYSDHFAQADAYNAALRGISYPLMYFDTLDDREDLEKYENIININGNGIIGYIDIDAIGVELPIYHGTSPEVLNSAAGHLEGTSLPVGGESTHSALSAHRGLPTA
ncbi:MAG: sortase, partial [Clostridia bacterium]|nr:sortase [Clostridia bacterium]